MNMMPTWSISARKSIGILYRELQEIDIYVEDADSEQLYRKLFSRIAHNIKIKKVIALNGRGNVISHCTEYNDDFPALFIIDGDLNLLHAERVTGIKRLFQHRTYCIENYLFCKHAAIELLQDASGKLSPTEAEKILEWDSFLDSIRQMLVDLFVTYAIAWKVIPEISTVSNSYHNLTIQITKRRGPELCSKKIIDSIEKLKELILNEIDLATYECMELDIRRVIEKEEEQLTLISGKDYLLKAYRDYLAFKGVSNLKFDEGFKFRLARHCDITPLNELSAAISTTSSGQEFIQQA